jgi:hypothetical protein
MNVQAPVVFDEAKLPELVHEPADPRACGSDHLGQHFLTDLRNHRFRLPLPYQSEPATRATRANRFSLELNS